MKKRQLASNLILFLFLLVVAAAALFSEIFQTPVKTGSQILEQARVFTMNDLSAIKRITLKNKTGEFIFERNPSNQSSPWHMISPRDVSANSLFIEKLFGDLTTIKIKKIFPDEKINASNFSLDKPTSTLYLTAEDGKTITVIVGLINTIDHTTYLKISERNGIFHVEAPNVPLENATMFDLIESQIFAINQDNVINLKITKGNKKSPPLLEIKKKEGNWYDQEGNLLIKEKVDDYFLELSNLKSSFIIDKQTEAQKRQISNLSRNPDYIVSIEDNKSNSVDYIVSGMIKDLSDLSLKNEEHFIVGLSNNSTIYVLKKEFHDVFNHKSDYLKAAILNK